MSTAIRLNEWQRLEVTAGPRPRTTTAAAALGRHATSAAGRGKQVRTDSRRQPCHEVVRHAGSELVTTKLSGNCPYRYMWITISAVLPDRQGTASWMSNPRAAQVGGWRKVSGRVTYRWQALVSMLTAANQRKRGRMISAFMIQCVSLSAAGGRFTCAGAIPNRSRSRRMSHCITWSPWPNLLDRRHSPRRRQSTAGGPHSK